MVYSLIKLNIWKYHTWFILLVIIGFSCAAIYSCVQILEEEGRAIASYKYKTSRINDINESFHSLENTLQIYFNEGRKADSLEKVSQKFADFQEQFIFANNNNTGFINVFKHDEIALINRIQSNIQNIVPEILEFKQGKKSALPKQVYQEIKLIEDELHSFTNIQTKAEKDLLSSELTRERRSRIFIAISMLGGSSAFLILFLVYKNSQLEESNRKKQEAFLLAKQQISAIEASSDGIGIMDAKRRLVYINDALAELHGITLNDKNNYIGRDWRDLYNKKGQAHIKDNVYPLLDSLGEWRGESRIMRKDGQLIEAELSLTLLPDGAGMIGTARDISARREVEEENRNLQSQVHQAQKMEAIGRLAGGIAHDFNNILAAINGYAEFLSEDLEKDKKLKTYADNILLAGQSARALIDQMLAFSRRKESEKSVINLIDIVHETISMISPGLPKEIELSADIHCDCAAYVHGDASLITQALMNIVVNAVDAMENDRGKLHISLSLIEPDEEMYEGMVYDELLPVSDMPHINIQEIDAGHINLELGRMKRGARYFQISISDTGTGMSQSVIEHIFEPFFTTKSVDKGTGLGMANVHGSIVTHQGAMIIDSILMEGTTFDLFFAQADYINDPSILGHTNNSAQIMDFAGVRILLVDDQQEVLNMMETLLTRAGFECIPMLSSLEALEYLREANDAFDLVITDQNMPKMTGLELIEQVAQLNEALPFIILSGYSNEKLAEIRDTYPMIKDCIRKPAKKDMLLAAIDKVLKETL